MAMTAEDVRRAAFSAVKRGRGYNPNEVDEFLNRVAAEFDAIEAERADAARAAGELASAQRELEGAKSRNDILQERLDNVQGQLDRTREQLGAGPGPDTSGLAAELGQANERISELSLELADAVDRAEEAERELELERAHGEAPDQSAEVARLEGEVANWRTQVTLTQNALDAAVGERDGAREQAEAATRELEALRARANAYQDLDSSREQISAALIAAQRAAADIEAEARASAKKTTDEAELRARAALYQSEKEKKALESEIDALKGIRAECRRELTETLHNYLDLVEKEEDGQ